jgi:hypothetical protein
MTTAQPGNSSSAFSSEERLDVQVVGRLVEQQQVAALLQRQRQVQPVALAAGEHARLLLLVRALEAEAETYAREGISTCRPGCSRARPRRPPRRLLRVDAAAVLVDVAELDRLADLDLAGVRLLEPDDRLEQRRLAGAVRADDADDAVARQR